MHRLAAQGVDILGEGALLMDQRTLARAIAPVLQS